MYIHFTNKNDNKFKHIYSMDRLQDLDRWCRRDIERLEEAIQTIKEYQMELFNHVQEVIQTNFKNVVVLTRRENWTTKRVEFYVHTEERPQIDKKHIDGQTIYGVYKDQKNFTGKERHTAIKYAEELSKKYNCPVERKGL